MATYITEPSRTFNEYLLIPSYSSADCTVERVDLQTPIVKFKKGEQSPLRLNIPLVSAIMQSVSNDSLAIALAKEGGLSFIYSSQSIAQQAAMVAKVKNHKAGFVTSDSNIRPEQSLDELIALIGETGHSTIAVTDDGKPNGVLMGIVTSRDYRVHRMEGSTPVASFMTPLKNLVYALDGISLSEANDMIWDHKLNTLPIIDSQGRLCSLVFRKDYDSHKEHPLELHDKAKRYVVGAGINTHDYQQRVPALIEAGANILCIDSSEGFTEWQQRTIEFVKKEYQDSIYIGAGNVVDAEGFRFLAESGADFIKVGIGGGSICITRETKGIGRGQASALIEVVSERDRYFEQTGIYIPICSDGGIVHDHHITLALAMGADFVMLGRYFARFDESPSNRVLVNGTYMKEYWGEGSNRARNWQRYEAAAGHLAFEEGVDSYVPYAGSLRENVRITLAKVRSTMCNCGSLSLQELRQNAKLTVVSSTSIVEGGAHDVVLKDERSYAKRGN
ncbi:MAG: IMP dehydrogenase [Sphaerochaetaceae bacterium]